MWETNHIKLFIYTYHLTQISIAINIIINDMQFKLVFEWEHAHLIIIVKLYEVVIIIKLYKLIETKAQNHLFKPFSLSR